MNLIKLKRVTIFLGLLIFPLFVSNLASARIRADINSNFPHKEGTLWSPYLEWDVTNPSYSGNPYDVIATVTFTHTPSGETRQTQMFYEGNNTWKFRFAGTQVGDWTFFTTSNDDDLNNHTGSITINANPESQGFVTHFQNKWAHTGSKQGFVPQFVMVSAPHNYANNPQRVDDEIQTFLVEHGFNGVHTPVFCRWFDINERDCDNISGSSPNPDPATFEALELLIVKTYEAGGVVHIWLWGDDARLQNPNSLPGGINGEVDQRLQRYIAARLGPLPGWTMGYGFDLFEWVSGDELSEWHEYMQAHMGWKHYLGARSNKNQLDQLSEAMSYSSYEQHRPDYDKYVQTIEARPDKPSFSEDRFRIANNYYDKDYDMAMTRRGLWQSAMAGGIANIWGNLQNSIDANDGSTTSTPYPNPEWIRTYADFINGRYFADMERCNDLTNGVCLKRPIGTDYIFYGENVTALQLDLSGMDGSQKAVAVDAVGSYSEIDLGNLAAKNQIWTAPYRSDWAIAVGDFSYRDCIRIDFTPTMRQQVVKSASRASSPYSIFLPVVQKNACGYH